MIDPPMIDRLVCIRAGVGVGNSEALLAARRAMATDDRWARRCLAAARRWFEDRLLLATCERVELLGVLRPGALLPPRLRGAAVLRGRKAAHHLLRVAAGLDSRIVGECHILGQVAAAGRVAEQAGCLGRDLREMLQAALRTGRRVRAETPLGRLAGSAVKAAAERVLRWEQTRPGVHEHLPSQRGTPCDAAPEGGLTSIVGILGGGAMAMEIADALGAATGKGHSSGDDLAGSAQTSDRRRITLFCRHVERAREAAGRRLVSIEPLDRLRLRLSGLDVLVAATSSPRPLVHPSDITGRSRPILIVDLGAPPNVDPAVAEIPGIDLVPLAELSGPDHARGVIASVERLVAGELADLLGLHVAAATGRAGSPGHGRRSRVVVLAAHGAGDGSEANALVGRVADEVGARRPQVAVHPAFHLGSPSLQGLAKMVDSAGSVAVLPLVTSEGWFLRDRLQSMLAAASGAGEAKVELLPPIGRSRRLRRAICDEALGCAAELARLDSVRSVRVIVVGHGTRRRADSGEATLEIVAELESRARSALAGCSVSACPAFLDQDPLLEAVAAESDADAHVVVPWLVGGGEHALVDVHQRLLHWSGHRHTRVLRPLGERAEFVEAVLDQIDWSDGDRVLRLGTRSTPLARRQADLAVTALRSAAEAAGRPQPRIEVVLMETEGDRDLRRPIEEFATDGPFTDDLDRALLDGRIDLAVHSLKDVPLALSRDTSLDTSLAAVLSRADAREALVTADGRGLDHLKPGSRVGTCSARRAAQLAAVRPDLVTAPMRGSVDRRLEAIDRGEYDAAILAVAGIERLGLGHRIAEVLHPEVMLCEAGQGALVLVTRADDQPARDLCASVDDAVSRAAVEIERRIAQAIEQGDWSMDRAAAAFAEDSSRPISAVQVQVDRRGRFLVRAKAIDRRTGEIRHVEHVACEAQGAVADTLAAFRTASRTMEVCA